MERGGAWRDSGAGADQDWDATPVEAVALCAYCTLCDWRFLPGGVAAEFAEVVRRWRRRCGGAIRDRADRDGGIECRRVVDEEYGVEERVPRDESAAIFGDDGRRGRRATGEILSKLS